MSVTIKKNKRRIAKSRLAAASAMVVEAMESRVMLTTTIAGWFFDTLPGTTSTSTIQTSPATTSGTGTANTVGMQSGTANGYLYPTSYTGAPTADASTFLAATGSADSGGNGGSEGVNNGFVWRVENGFDNAAAIGSQGVQFNASTAGDSGIEMEWDMCPSSTGAPAQFAVEYTTDVQDVSPVWTNVTQDLSFGAGDVTNAAESQVATIGTSPTNSVYLQTNPASGGNANIITGTYATITGPNPSGTNTSWLNDLTLNLSSISGVNNQANFAIRVVNAATGTSETTILNEFGTQTTPAAFKNWRFNDIRIEATGAGNSAPTINTNPTSQSVPAGQSVSFSAAASGTPTPTVQWFEGGSPGATGVAGTGTAVTTTNFPSETGATTNTLTFTTSSTAADNGDTFYAEYTNSVGVQDTTAASLADTLATPVVTTQPTSVTTTAGNVVMFTAAATGSPLPTVQWQVSTNGGSTWNNDTTDSGNTTDTLTVDTVSGDNNNEYRALFTNSQAPSGVPSSGATLMLGGSLITAWNFLNGGALVNGQTDLSPGPSTGTGTSNSLGMGPAGTYSVYPGVPALPFTLTVTDSSGSYTTPLIAADDVQTMTVTASTGSYQLVFGGDTTGTLAFNAPLATLQTSLASLGDVGMGNVTVTGTTSAAAITFTGTLSNASQSVITVANSSSENKVNTIAHTTTGSSTAESTSAAIIQSELQALHPATTSGITVTTSPAAGAAAGVALTGDTSGTLSGTGSGIGFFVALDAQATPTTTGLTTAQVTSSPDDSNIVAQTDTGSPNGDPAVTNIWRIVGTNGWNSNAPIGTQGAQFLTSTSGFSSIEASFDLYATAQGEAKMQVEYTTNGGTTWTNVPAGDLSIGSGTTNISVQNNTNVSDTNTVQGGYFNITAANSNSFYNDLGVNLAGISGVNNDSGFGLRIVNASTGADCVNITGAALNNSSGNDRLGDIQITGNNPVAPTITTNPTSQAVASGTIAAFTAAAYGYPAPTVQWEVSTNGGTTFVPDTTDAGNTTTTLQVLASPGKAGNEYEAVFTNSVGTTPTSAATLSVGPLIVTQPIGQTVAAGTVVNLMAVATGSPTPTVQWQISTNGGATFTNITGATSTTYSFTAAEGLTGLVPPSYGLTGDEYQAIFTNTGGTVTSAVATLTVQGTPITQWDFTQGEPPSPEGGSGSGNEPFPTLSTHPASDASSVIGLTDDYSGTESFPEADILVERSTLNPSFSEYDWRVRGGSGLGPTGSPGTPDGWSQFAPEYTQGVQFDVNTSGYSNITLHFDWNQGGIADMQPQYSANGSSGPWVNVGPIIQATGNNPASGSDFYGLTAATDPTGITVDLQGVTAANNNPNFELRLVSAYDPGLPMINDGNLLDPTLHGQYASSGFSLGGQDAVQAITLNDEPDGTGVGQGNSNNFQLAFNGLTTGVITNVSSSNQTAMASNVQTALAALSTIGGTANISVANVPGTEFEYTVTFQGAMKNLAEPLLVSSTPFDTVATWTAGTNVPISTTTDTSDTFTAGTGLNIGVAAVSPFAVGDTISIGSVSLLVNSDTSGAIQAMTATGSSGSYQLVFNGDTTATLAFNAPLSTIQSSLAALGDVGPGNVTVTGTTAAAVITFQGTLAGQSEPAITVSNINDSAANTIAQAINVTPESSGSAVAGAVIALDPVTTTTAAYGFTQGTALNISVANGALYTAGESLAITSSTTTTDTTDTFTAGVAVNIGVASLMPFAVGDTFTIGSGKTPETFLVNSINAAADTINVTPATSGSATAGTVISVSPITFLVNSITENTLNVTPATSGFDVSGATVTQLGISRYVDGGGSWQLGNISFNGDLTTGAPSITGEPASVTVAGGYTTSFTAATYSEESLSTVQWQFSNNNAASWNNVSATDSTGGTTIDGPELLSGTTGAATDDVQTMTAAGSSGSYQLVFNGDTTATLAFNAPLSTIQSSLAALGDIGSGNVTVTGSSAAAVITFQGTLASLPESVITVSNIDDNKTNTVAHTTTGQVVSTTMQLQLASGFNTTANFYVGDTVTLIPVQGPGESAVITASTSTGVVTFAALTTAPLAGSTNFIITGPVTSTTLSYTAILVFQANANLSDNGDLFRAVFTSGAGITDTFVENPGGPPLLTVVAPTAPAIGVQPFNASVQDGNPAIFTASAIGDPTPSVQWQINTGADDVNDVQTITATGSAGSYQLVFDGDISGTLPFNASVSAIQSSLTALAEIGSGNVTVTGSSASAVVTFQGALAAGAEPVIAVVNINDNSVDTVAHTTTGTGWTDLSNSSTVSGATSDQLIFTTTSDLTENGDQFRAVFTNAVAETNTNIVKLTVLAAENNITNWDFNQYSMGTQGAAEVETMTATGSSGSYQLVFNGETTGTLAFNQDLSTIQNSLTALPNIGAGNVTVTGTTAVAVITFQGALIAPEPLITVANINDNAPNTIVQTTLGVGPEYNNSPAPTGGLTDVGTAEPVGMDLPYNTEDAATGTDGNGAVAVGDVTNSPGSLNPNFNENTWRVRSGPAAAGPSGAGTPANGWSNFVPEYSQGVQFSVPTTGYANVYVTMDWYSTTSGELDAQEQYTVGGTTVAVASGSITNGGADSIPYGNNYVATLNASNSFKFGDEVTVSGLSSAYNGTYQVVAATSTSFSYYVSGAGASFSSSTTGSAYVPTWTNIGPQVQAVSNDFYGATAGGAPIPLVINVSNIPGASNNPNFGIRLVNAYDYTLSNDQELVLNDRNNFQLTFNGRTTGTILFNGNANAEASNIQAALIALPNVGAGNVSVSLSTGADGGYAVQFTNALDNSIQPVIVPSDTSDLVVQTNQYANAELVGTPPGPAPYNGSKGNWRFDNIEVHGTEPEFFSASNYAVNEDAGTASITVNRTGSTTIPVTVNYATSDGTAVNGTDYTATSGTLTIPAGQSSAMFTVPLIDVATAAGTRVFDVTLSSPGATGSLGSPVTSTVTITDNGAAVAPTLSSSIVGDGTAQRSTISSMTVVFSEPVNFSASSFTLQQSQNDTSWTNVSADVTVSNPSSDGMTWVISCNPGSSIDRTAAANGGTTNAGLFANGIYQLTLNGAAITDKATGTAKFNGGGNLIVPFSFDGGASMKNAFAVLFGDVSGNSLIGTSDLTALKNAFGSQLGENNYNAAFNYTGNGLIGTTALTEFKDDFGAEYVFT